MYEPNGKFVKAWRIDGADIVGQSMSLKTNLGKTEEQSDSAAQPERGFDDLFQFAETGIAGAIGMSRYVATGLAVGNARHRFLTTGKLQ